MLSLIPVLCLCSFESLNKTAPKTIGKIEVEIIMEVMLVESFMKKCGAIHK